MALSFELELLSTEVLDFVRFCACQFCDLDLDPMISIYVDPNSLEKYRICKHELFTLRLLKVID